MRLFNKIALFAVLSITSAEQMALAIESDAVQTVAHPLFLKEQWDDRQHSFKEIAEEHGYGYEKHSVTTEDGYILQLDRILPKGGLKEGAPVVLFQHGIEDSAVQWIINSEELAPAFIASRAGFDVWLGNNRGTDFSLNHTSLSPKSKEFWDFDWEQMGTYDIPAYVDYILNKTGIAKLDAYIGHSEGTTQFFAGASLKPDFYADKVKLFVGCAPVTRLDHSSNMAMVYASQIIKPITALVEAIGLYDLISLSKTPQWLLGEFCTALPKLCQYSDQGFIDWSDEIDNTDREGDKFAHSPAGSGWRNLVHYAQVIKAKQFQRYDYGTEQNKKLYGQELPPKYALDAIKTPMVLYHGDIDELANPTDVAWLLDESQSGLKKKYVVHEEQLHFGHNTFSIGRNMTYVHESMLPYIMKAHNGTLF